MHLSRRLIAPAPTALALLALAGCGAATKTVTVGGPPKGFTAAATLPAASKTTADAGAPIRVLHLANFRSPTGNIGCLLLPDDARCDIERRGWSPPQRPANCPAIVDFGQGLQMGATGAPSFVCAGDTVRELTAPGLGYGEASRVGPFECLSRSSGMTCTRRSDGHGFFLSIQSYRIF